MKSRFVFQLNKKYPNLSTQLLEQQLSDQLLSPFQVNLTSKQISAIKNEINGYWALRNWGEKNISSHFTKYGLRKAKNYSVCMSYDFHINPEGNPELIEINTNAAFLALGLEFYTLLGLPNPAGKFSEDMLMDMFRNEMQICGAGHSSIAIIDENPQQQRLFIEMLVYKELFIRQGIACEVFSIEEFDKFRNYSLIYNRYTDFYLQNPKSREIKLAYNSEQLHLSPQPFEYYLLADKERLLDWNRQTEVPKPASLLNVYDMATEDPEKIWAERKNLFFKPKNSFGGKQAYKGASISRKVFEEVRNPNFIGQQLSAPSQLLVEIEGVKHEFKYDLRCFTYKNELQLIIARLYLGQMTNLKTPGGGFACITID